MAHGGRPVHRASLRRCLAVGIVLAPLGFGVALSTAGPAAAAGPGVDLGVASTFAVLAHTTVTNTGPSLITGDLGLSPGTSVTNFPPGVLVGNLDVADTQAGLAQAAASQAFTDASAPASTATISADLGGQTLGPGVYDGGALAVTGSALTLNGGGNPNAVFIFRAASTLNVASSVALIGSANACNVFWQVGSSATLGVGSTIVGTVDAMQSVTAQTNATITGRLLALNGAVTLDTNTVNASSCQPVIGPPAPTATPTPTPTASVSATSTATPAATASSRSTPRAVAVATRGQGTAANAGNGLAGPTSLPFTGSPVAALALVALAAILAGALMLSHSRYRGAHVS